MSKAVLHGGELALAISTAVVRELASTTGRGPMSAKTTFGDNAVFVVLQDTLTRGERSLVDAGESSAVLRLRRLWQTVMRDSCSKAIEELTHRKVVGFMSDNHIDPDIAVEVFILEALAGDRAKRPPPSSDDSEQP
ncbi:MAG: Na-translocating system protein MpsC family protein [Solirubrobacteraceae bacterium]